MLNFLLEITLLSILLTSTRLEESCLAIGITTASYAGSVMILLPYHQSELEARAYFITESVKLTLRPVRGKLYNLKDFFHFP